MVGEIKMKIIYTEEELKMISEVLISIWNYLYHYKLYRFDVFDPSISPQLPFSDIEIEGMVSNDLLQKIIDLVKVCEDLKELDDVSCLFVQLEGCEDLLDPEVIERFIIGFENSENDLKILQKEVNYYTNVLRKYLSFILETPKNANELKLKEQYIRQHQNEFELYFQSELDRTRANKKKMTLIK